jgi:hypothetical protein
MKKLLVSGALVVVGTAFVQGVSLASGGVHPLLPPSGSSGDDG